MTLESGSAECGLGRPSIGFGEECAKTDVCASAGAGCSEISNRLYKVDAIEAGSCFDVDSPLDRIILHKMAGLCIQPERDNVPISDAPPIAPPAGQKRTTRSKSPGRGRKIITKKHRQLLPKTPLKRPPRLPSNGQRFSSFGSGPLPTIYEDCISISIQESTKSIHDPTNSIQEPTPDFFITAPVADEGTHASRSGDTACHNEGNDLVDCCKLCGKLFDSTELLREHVVGGCGKENMATTYEHSGAVSQTSTMEPQMHETLNIMSIVASMRREWASGPGPVELPVLQPLRPMHMPQMNRPNHLRQRSLYLPRVPPSPLPQFSQTCHWSMPLQEMGDAHVNSSFSDTQVDSPAFLAMPSPIPLPVYSPLASPSPLSTLSDLSPVLSPSE